MLSNEIAPQSSYLRIPESTMFSACDGVKDHWNLCVQQGFMENGALSMSDQWIFVSMYDEKGRVLLCHMRDGVCLLDFVRVFLNWTTDES